MDQKEIHNDITNKINSIKTLYEKKGDSSITGNQGSSYSTKSSMNSHNVSDKISLYQSQLKEFEERRNANKFADITKKFGLNTLIYNSDAMPDYEISAELKRIRGSIITSNPDDFNSRKRKFEAKKETGNVLQHSNSNMTGFIQEATSMFENYEKEIEFLRHKLSEIEKEHKHFAKHEIVEKELKHFAILEIVVNEHKFEIPKSEKITFINHMNFFSNREPGMAEFATAYNEKMCELFDENEKLQNTINNYKNKDDELEKLKKKITDYENRIKEKDEQIKNTNEIYSQKFSEIFMESANLTNQIDDLKKEKSDLEIVYNNENKLLREAVVKNENSIKEYVEKIASLEKKMQENKELLEKKFLLLECEKNEVDNEKIILQNEVKNLEARIVELNEKIENLKKENAEVVENLKLENSSHFENITKENILITDSLKNENFLLQEKLSTNEKILEGKNSEISNLRKLVEEGGKEVENKMQELQNKLELENKLKRAEEELEDLNKRYKRLENKVDLQNEENENLREIITKDQIRLKELKEFKEKAENNNEETHLLQEENNLLKNEIKLFKQRVEEELSKLEEANKQKEEVIGEREDLKKEMERKEKIIENLNQVNEDLKQRMRELEEEMKKVVAISNERTLVKEVKKEVALEEEQKERKLSVKEVRSDSVKCAISSDSSLLSKELIIDYIYYLYLYDNSINLQQIVDVVLNNFNLYMSSIFIKKEKDDYRLPFSIMHEFLEDVYFLLYETYIKSKLSDNKVITNDMWIVNPEDINLEMIKGVCNRVLNESNIITYLNSIRKKEKTLDEIIQIFLNKYERTFKLKEASLSEMVMKEVRPIVLEKIERYKKCLLNELQTIMQYAVSNFHSGKIVYNNRQIYDFKEFFVEYLTRDIKIKDTINASENITTPETVDNLSFTIKMNGEHLKNAYFNGSFNVHLPKTQNALSKLSLTMILYSPRLVNLSITNCHLTENQLFYIVKLIEFMKNLKLLDLSGNDIKEEGVKILAEHLKVNKNIQYLYLNKNNILSNGGFYLADAFIKNQTIETLSISDNTINDSGLSALLTVLMNNNYFVKYLDLSNNLLNSNDFKNIAELIQTNHSIKILNLSNNFIDPQAAHYLGLSIKNALSLSVVYLQNTNLNDENAPLLLKNLGDSKISEFYLDNNPLGEIGAILLANNLKHSTDVKFVSIKKCNLSSMSLMCLSKLFDTNVGLEGLNLEDNQFDDNSIAVLHKSTKNKNVKIYLTASLLNSRAKEIIKNSDSYILH